MLSVRESSLLFGVAYACSIGRWGASVMYGEKGGVAIFVGERCLGRWRETGQVFTFIPTDRDAPLVRARSITAVIAATRWCVREQSTTGLQVTEIANCDRLGLPG